MFRHLCKNLDMMRRGLFRVASSRRFSSAAALPQRVKIYEVGARDGLQNEPTLLKPDVRIKFINELSATGVAAVETAAFVNAKLVPQMSGAAEVVRGVTESAGILYPVLVPNARGFEASAAAGVKAVAVMAAASETFSQNNVNSSVQQALDRALDISSKAAARGIAVRGYISCCLGCPFEGAIRPEVTAEIARALYEGGCYEVVISDTIGTGTPGSMARLLQLVTPHVSAEHLAVHCHDTYGQALANILVALQHGVSTVDSSVAGLGGCPFAGPGASGNVATEDVVYMLNGLGVETGVDFDRVVDTGEWIVRTLGRNNASKAGVASLRSRQAAAACSS